MRSTWKRAQDERAQGVIEFALLSVALMLFFLGTVDFARFMYYDTAIRNGARVGMEAAINQCPNSSRCGLFGSSVINDGVFQSAECEAVNDGRVSLQPQISCNACISTLTGCTGGDPCSTTACGTNPQWCDKDMCLQRINPTAACSAGTTCDPCQSGQGTTASNNSFKSGQCVVLTVGYNFQPISPFMSRFFPTQACWSGDSTTHTLCATAKGLVY